MRFALQAGAVEPWWINFVKSIRVQITQNPHQFIKLRDEELKKYNARIVSGNPDNFVEFDNEKDAIYFILKWS